LRFKSPFPFVASEDLITLLLDITFRAKQHWISISATPQLWIIWKYKECLQLLGAIDDYCVPALVAPDEMGEEVYDIDAMFD